MTSTEIQGVEKKYLGQQAFSSSGMAETDQFEIIYT